MRIRPMLCGLVALGSGCYRYVAVGDGDLLPGVTIAVDLTPLGTDTLARWIGPGMVALEGRLLEADPAELTLGVTAVRGPGGVESYWKGETVRVPRLGVAAVRERRVSYLRSALAGSLVVAAALAVGETTGGSTGAPPGGGQPPPPK